MLSAFCVTSGKELFWRSPLFPFNAEAIDSAMGGGNGQKAKMAREKNLEKQKGAKGTFSSLTSFASSIPRFSQFSRSLFRVY